MVGIAIAKHCDVFVGEIADGVVRVRAVLLRLIGPEGAGARDQTNQIVVGERMPGGEKTVDERGDVAVRVVAVDKILLANGSAKGIEEELGKSGTEPAPNPVFLFIFSSLLSI